MVRKKEGTDYIGATFSENKHDHARLCSIFNSFILRRTFRFDPPLTVGVQNKANYSLRLYIYLYISCFFIVLFPSTTVVLRANWMAVSFNLCFLLGSMLCFTLCPAAVDPMESIKQRQKRLYLCLSLSHFLFYISPTLLYYFVRHPSSPYLRS